MNFVQPESPDAKTFAGLVEDLHNLVQGKGTAELSDIARGLDEINDRVVGSLNQQHEVAGAWEVNADLRKEIARKNKKFWIVIAVLILLFAGALMIFNGNNERELKTCKDDKSKVFGKSEEFRLRLMQIDETEIAPRKKELSDLKASCSTVDEANRKLSLDDKNLRDGIMSAQDDQKKAEKKLADCEKKKTLKRTQKKPKPVAKPEVIKKQTTKLEPQSDLPKTESLPSKKYVIWFNQNPEIRKLMVCYHSRDLDVAEQKSMLADKRCAMDGGTIQMKLGQSIEDWSDKISMDFFGEVTAKNYKNLKGVKWAGQIK